MVHMHMGGRSDQVKVVVLDVGEPFLQLRLMVVVHQGHHADHLAVLLPLAVDKIPADEIPDRFRAVDVAAAADKGVELRQQLFFKGDGKSFEHAQVPFLILSIPARICPASLRMVSGRLRSRLARFRFCTASSSRP